MFCVSLLLQVLPMLTASQQSHNVAVFSGRLVTDCKTMEISLLFQKWHCFSGDHLKFSTTFAVAIYTTQGYQQFFQEHQHHYLLVFKPSYMVPETVGAVPTH